MIRETQDSIARQADLCARAADAVLKADALATQRQHVAMQSWHCYGVQATNSLELVEVTTPAKLNPATNRVEASVYQVNTRTGECDCPDCQNRVRKVIVEGRLAFKEAGRDWRTFPKFYCKHTYIVAIAEEQGAVKAAKRPEPVRRPVNRAELAARMAADF
jgi:hypothetical protein